MWGAAYAVGLAAFMLVLLTIPKSWGVIPGDFVRWLAIFLGCAIVAVALWAVNAVLVARKAKRDTAGNRTDDAGREQGEQHDTAAPG